MKVPLFSVVVHTKCKLWICMGGVAAVPIPWEVFLSVKNFLISSRSTINTNYSSDIADVKNTLERRLALWPRVLSPRPLPIYVYKQKRARVAYPNKNLGNWSIIFLTRTHVADKQTRSSLEKLWYAETWGSKCDLGSIGKLVVFTNSGW